MQAETATTIFEVLSSEARLAVFRLLVRYAPDGLVAGDIARMLDIPKTNLSFHLKALVHGKLASVEREGRNTRYKANIPLMLETIAYLTAECCSSKPDQCRSFRAESGVAPEFLPTIAETMNRDAEKISSSQWSERMDAIEEYQPHMKGHDNELD